MDWSKCTADGTASGVPRLTCLPQLFTVIVFYAMLFAGILAIIIIIWAGIKYVRSGGDTKQTQGARQTLTFAIIGLILILGSMFVLNAIATVTGVRCFLNFGFSSCQGAETDRSVHAGQTGCFASVSGGKPFCSPYSPDNNPKEPYEWFDQASDCTQATCADRYGQ